MDVFISYEHESKSIADNICAVLESKGVRCWYAPRDVYGDYATSIVEAIEHCKVFILILNHSSSESPHVLNEVEMAYKRILNGEITIIPFKVDEGILSKAMEYYVKRLHWIDAVSAPLEKSILELYQKLVPILGITEREAEGETEPKTNLVRKANQYYTPEDLVEVSRIAKEEKVLFEIERPYYDKLFFGKSDVNVLDFDVLCAESAIKKFNRPEVAKAVFFSYNESVVREGNELCADNDNFKFFHLDATDGSIDEIFRSAMGEMNIDSFDFVNLTMAIMNLENPFKTLKKIRKYMHSGAVAYVRDVDDGVVFAYPDKDGLFREFFDFYKYDTFSGSRESARQVFNFMRKLGAKDVRLEKAGVSTASMDYDDKRLLFEAWFGFIPNDFRLMLKEDSANKFAQQVLDWIDENYDELEEQFFEEDFLFNSGYLIYTVRF